MRRHYRPKKDRYLLAALILALSSVSSSTTSKVAAEPIEHNFHISGIPHQDESKLDDSGIELDTEVDPRNPNNFLKITYDYGGKDHLFRVEDNDAIASPTKGAEYIINNVDSSGKKGTIYIRQVNTYPNAYEGVSGLNASNGVTMTVNSNLDITTYSAYASAGIYTANNSNLIINGNVRMIRDDKNDKYKYYSPWGVATNNLHGNFGIGGDPTLMPGENGQNYKGARWHPSGFQMFWGRGHITVNGDVDIAIRGTAVQTGVYSAQNGVHPYYLGTINLLGNSVRIITPENLKCDYLDSDGNEFFESVYSLASYGGTVNVSVKDTDPTSGKSEGNLTPTGGKTNIVGNVLALKRSKNTTKRDTYQDGRLNIALTTKDSLWRGVVDNAGKEHAGEVNVWVSNGASWQHEETSPTNGMDHQHMPKYSKPDYGIYDNVSYLNQLHGGIGEAKSGFITLKSKSKMHIEKYSGYNTFIYEHTADGSEKDHYIGGDVTIVHAASGSGVTLATKNNGIDTDDEDLTDKVLSALAQKLMYENYKNEHNIMGKVMIASGLTSSSVTGVVEGILAFEENGEGKYKKPKRGEQAQTNIEGAITGSRTKDETYRKGNIVQHDGTYKFTLDTTLKKADGVIVDAQKDVKIDASDNALNFKAKTGIKTNGKKVNIEAQYLNVGVSDEKVTDGIEATGGEVSISGKTNILAKEKAVNVTNKGKVHIEKVGEIKGAVISDDGEITLNKKGENASVTGDIAVQNSGTIDLTVKGKKEFLKGNIVKKSAISFRTLYADGSVHLKVLDGAKWEGAVNNANAEVNLTLAGGTWKNYGTQPTTINELKVDKYYLTPIKWQEPKTKEQKNIDINGYISMEKGAGSLTIDKYSGTHIISYVHENDGSKVEDYQGGDITIKGAKKDAIVILATDRKKILLSDKNAVEKTFNALAKKLYYQNADKNNNLKGKFLIASGLTANTIYHWLGDMNFDEKNKGQARYKPSSAVHITGDYETAIMKGVRAGMTSALLSWRSMADDLIYRGDELRNHMEKEGLWARVYGGRDSYKENGIDIRHTFSGTQLGYDRVYPRGFIAGVAVDYQKGNGDYEYLDDDFGLVRGNNGKTEIYSIGFYGSRTLANNDHLDWTLKSGNVGNNYRVYNGIRTQLKGDYNDRAYGISLRYGKKYGIDTKYFEPQLQLTYAHVGSKKYFGEAEKEKLAIGQGSFSSIVGSIGVEGSQKGAFGKIYGKLKLMHEFNGSVDGTYYASDGGLKSSKLSMKDTWLEMGLGSSLKLGEEGTLNLDISKTFGSKYSKDFKVMGSLRFLFGPKGVAKDQTSTKVQSTAKARKDMPSATTSDTMSTAQGTFANKQAPKAQEQSPETIKYTKTKTTAENASDTTYQIENNIRANYNNTDDYILGNIIVTARRIEQPILEAKSDLSIVTRQEIEELHMNSVEEVLRTVPGIQFLNYGHNGMNANLSGIRINGSNDVLVLVDGVRISAFKGSGSSGYMYSSFLKNMDNVESIEVLRGAQAAIYGTDAKGGVINIITRKVKEQKTTLDVARGTFGIEEARLSTQGKHGKISYHLNYDKFIDGNMKDGAGKLWEGNTNTRQFAFNLGYDLNEKQKLTFNYSDAKTRYSGRDYIYGDFKVGDPYHGTYSTKLTSLTHTFTISKAWANKFTYRITDECSIYTKPKGEGSNKGNTGENNNTEADNHEINKNKPYIASNKYDYTFITEQAEYKDHQHSIVFGIDWMKGEGEDVNTGTGKNLSKNWVKNISFFLQDEWKFLPKLALTYGMRYDSPSNSAKKTNLPTNTAKSFKLSYDITTKDSIYMAKNDFFIIPSMSQFFDPEYGNDELKPTVGNTKTIGFNHAFSNRDYLTINWFDTITDIGIYFEVEKDEHGKPIKDANGKDKYKRVNYKNGKSSGINLQYNTSLGEHLTARLGWTYLNYREKDNFSLGYAPKHKATFALYFQKEKYSVAFDGFYFIRDLRHAKKDKKGWPSDNYAVCNFALNYRPIEDTEIYFKVNNVFNKLWAEHTDTIWGNTNPEAWYSMPGRSFMLGMKHSF